MKRVPNIREVVQHIKKVASDESQTKLASPAVDTDLSTDVGKSLHAFAQQIKTASLDEVTFDDVISLGNRLMGTS